MRGSVKPIEGVPVYGGLDLSAVNDLTALVLTGRVDGIWQVHPTFWLPAEGLREKAAKDRVPYDVWRDQGHLLAAPGKSVDYEYVAEYLRGLFDRLDVRKIAFDRWGFKHLKPWLLKAGFSEQQIEGDDAVFEEFGQGFQSMSPALRDLEGEILNGRLAHGAHPVLTMCAANAVVQTDPAGNRKLAKHQERVADEASTAWECCADDGDGRSLRPKSGQSTRSSRGASKSNRTAISR
jgi:phage terminase large subunit-like protein